MLTWLPDINDLEIVSISQQIHLMQDPGLIVVEIAGKGRIISTGRAYNARYVWVMRTNEGKLIHMRDYWNPLAALEARGGLDSSKQNVRGVRTGTELARLDLAFRYMD